MTKKTVTLVELSVYHNILPLVAGYLEAYALTDPELARWVEFDKYVTSLDTDPDQIFADLLGAESDVYAFSCYMWNSRLAVDLATRLARARPACRVMLGGPQVMNYGQKYLLPDLGNVFICNGAGESLFRDFLRQAFLGDENFASLQGISFYSDGVLIDTGRAEEVADVNSIPSPYLTGLFDGIPCTNATFESNRGCPYLCTFCFFSKGDNHRIYKFDEARVKEELRWLAKRGAMYIFICDANFGVFPRDIEFAEYMCELKREFGVPRIVNYAAAKNRPDQVSQIAELFQNAGMVHSQPVSFQSLNPDTLKAIKRKNIKTEKYQALLENMNEKQISSMVELIWPLPEETLKTFKQSLDVFCSGDADFITLYPLVLLHNTTMEQDRDQFGAVTAVVPSGAGEAEIVIATNKVSEEEYRQGLALIYAVHGLRCSRGLFRLGRYLDRELGIRHTELYSAFCDFMKTEPDHVVCRFVADEIDSMRYHASTTAMGTWSYTLLHAERERFLDFLFRFVGEQPWWGCRQARLAFELDVLTLPYLFTNSPLFSLKTLADYLEILKPLEIRGRSYRVEMSEDAWGLLERLGDEVSLAEAGNVLVVDHQREQFGLSPKMSEARRAAYSYGMIKRIRAILPRVESEAGVLAADAAGLPDGTVRSTTAVSGTAG